MGAIVQYNVTNTAEFIQFDGVTGTSVAGISYMLQKNNILKYTINAVDDMFGIAMIDNVDYWYKYTELIDPTTGLPYTSLNNVITALTADMTGVGVRVQRSESNLPQSTSSTIFTVSGGACIICYLLGEVVTTDIQAGTNNMKLILNATTGADVDLCGIVDIDADAIGTMYSITGTLSDAMIATPSGAAKAQPDFVTVAPGTIDLSCSASKTGKIRWTIYYTPVIAGAKIVAS